MAPNPSSAAPVKRLGPDSMEGAPGRRAALPRERFPAETPPYAATTDAHTERRRRLGRTHSFRLLWC
ncbi:hypothetical protein MRX96_054534 [Rhipicephalus microplus]